MINTTTFRSFAIALALPASLSVAQAPTLRVALCGAASTTNTACQWTSTQASLQATGLFAAVDIINVTASGVGTPTLASLLQYDALLCYTNSTPANNITWGDVLADYVDAGGGVVVAVFANSTTSTGRNIAGRWQSGYEVILDQSGNTSGAGGSLGTVAVPTHPVMNNVTSFTGGTIGSRPVGTALEVGATLIASWSSGHVLVAEGLNPRRIDLGFYPPPATCSQSGWASGGDVLMANALVHVSNGARFSPYGAGCSGALGVPTLAAAPGSRPTFGNVFQLDVGNLPIDIGVIGMGFSDVASGPFALPFDLTIFGLTGCSLYADPAVTLFLIGASGSASSLLGIPMDPSLQDLLIFTQAFALDLPANPAGLTVSNAGRIRVGA
jgi:hypothetical protein